MRFKQTASQVVTAAPLYSASVLDNVTVGSFLRFQEIAPLPRDKTNLEVDRLLSL